MQVTPVSQPADRPGSLPWKLCDIKRGASMNAASGRSSGRETRPAQKSQNMLDRYAQQKIDEARHVAAAKEASAAHEVDKANIEIHKRQLAGAKKKTAGGKKKKIITDEEARMMNSPVY